MKNWKEYPYLFANGKFKLKDHDGTVLPIHGYSCYTNPPVFKVNNPIDNIFHEEVRIIDWVTLIARKIEDMTDEESSLFGRYGYADDRQPDVWQDIRNLISEHASQDYFSPSEFIQLLDLGVYPFDQRHFEDETVIDIKTL